ncbi:MULTISPECIES: tetratricopeptide repeat protein [Amycolatopsis]|uniref:Tetratricopeptide repeat protein n=1 Tax=Amycolatopsis dendrobii TaxID=2760662 RepID=A0A7W3ZG02_9PSEU|nr:MULTISPECIES: tetratricopeptide repeat protein [Amycolatopsis]MBB1159583.1 tetratricopeptide repeat protein [Amycolatopsis dendrobii]UKD57334.1 tetratricopeptide repeat protein [Amycolatopsis sp. FU40]
MGTGDRHENLIAAEVSGPVVQAGVVHGDVHVHSRRERRTVPRQLLPVSASFTDRERELAELDRLIGDQQRQGPRVAVIAGSGGVGKTALASRWIAGHADRFPDGQLYADLGAFGAEEPASPDEVLSQFLRALGVPSAQIPAELAAQTALYRSVTAGLKLAVLADDADSAAQVRPLVPASPHSVVVVTSRWRLGALAMDGARVLLVEPLSSVSALELLRRAIGIDRVKTEPEPAQQLVELCGGLPIAVCVAAARLSTRPRWPISRLVGALADERRRLSALAVADEAVVQASFDLSADELAPDIALVYRLSGLHPGPDFGAEVAAAAVDRPAADVEDALDALVDASLLTDAGPDRYRFHDLARVHARQQAETQESESSRTAAVHRMITWYLDRVLAADLVITPLRARISPGYERIRSIPAPPDATAALDWLERELANIVAAMRVAADQVWPELVWQFCEGLWGLFLHRKHYRQWQRTHSWGVDAARRCGNRRAEARLEVQLGYAHLNTGRYDAAKDHFTASLKVALAIDDSVAQARAWEHLGVVAHSTGSPREAYEHYARALAIAEELRQPRSIALHRRRLGEACRDLDRPAEAVEHFERSAEIAREIGDEVLRGRAMTRLGDQHLRLGDSTAACSLLREAADLLGQHGAAAYQAEALEALAEADLAADHVESARLHLEQALATYAVAEDPKAERVSARIAAIAAGKQKPGHGEA